MAYVQCVRFKRPYCKYGRGDVYILLSSAVWKDPVWRNLLSQRKKTKILTMNENCAEMDWRGYDCTGPCLVAKDVTSNYDVILMLIHLTDCD